MAEMKQPEKGVKDTHFTGGALDDHVISISSSRNGFGGYYMDCHHSKEARVSACNYTDVVTTKWCKFLVHKVNDQVVVLESIRYRNHYLDCNHKKKRGNYKVLITHSNNPPLKAAWAQWKVIGQRPSDIVFESCRYAGYYLDAHHSKKVYATKSKKKPGDWAHWKVIIGSPMEGMKDGYKVIDAISNDLDHEIENTVQLKIGLSSTEADVGGEVEKNFGAGPFASASIKVSCSYSDSWSSSTSDTWSKEITKKVVIKVPAKTTIRVLQMYGSYGRFKIGSSHWKVEKVEYK